MTEDPPRIPGPTRPFPGFAQALLVLLLFVVFTGIASAPAGILKVLGFTRAVPWAALAGQLGGTALTLMVCTALGHQRWRDYFPHRPVAPGVWPLAALATVGIILLSNGMDGLLQRMLPSPAWLDQAFENMGWPGLIIGAPLTEEPLLRGVLLGGFLLRYGSRKAITYSALLFALVHLNPWQFPTALLAGLFLGWLMVRTGSLWPGVLAHFTNNLAAYLAEAWRIPYMSDHRLQPLWMWALGGILMGLGGWGLHRILNSEGKDISLAETLP